MNLVDLVDGFENPEEPITIFNTVKALSEYTIRTGKYFPRDNVHAGSLLKYLLRQILNPPSERNNGYTGSRGGKKRARRRRHGGV